LEISGFRKRYLEAQFVDARGRKTRPQKIIIILSAAIAIAVLAAAYAATSLSVNNAATITTGAPNLFMVTGVTSTTTCSASTGTYADTGLTVNWGSVVQGSTANQYVCLENTGSPHSLTVTNTLPSGDGTLTATIGGTPATGQTINHNAFALITLTWIVDPSAPATSISFGVSVS
jgi:hypothetical protein